MNNPRNEEYWQDVYDLPVFTNKNHPNYDEAWKWAEKLQNTGHLTQRDIIAFAHLLSICCSYQEGS